MKKYHKIFVFDILWLQYCININKELITKANMTREFVKKYEGGLSSFLPKGAIKRIAEKLKKPATSVSLIIHKGEWEDDAVVEEAIAEIKTDLLSKSVLLAAYDVYVAKRG